MDGKLGEESGAYVEFDSASLRIAPRIYGGAFQLNYNADEAVLTFGNKGEALPSEGGELDGKNFAEVVVFLNPHAAEELAGAMVEMIDFWVRKDVLDEEALSRLVPLNQSVAEVSD